MTKQSPKKSARREMWLELQEILGFKPPLNKESSMGLGAPVVDLIALDDAMTAQDPERKEEDISRYMREKFGDKSVELVNSLL